MRRGSLPYQEHSNSQYTQYFDLMQNFLVQSTSQLFILSSGSFSGGSVLTALCSVARLYMEESLCPAEAAGGFRR